MRRHRPLRRLLLCTLLPLCAVNCGDDETTGPEQCVPATVQVTPSQATIEPGGTVQLTAVSRDASGSACGSVTWSSNNEAVAGCSSSGLVTGVAPGTAVISATADGVTDAAVITVQVSLVGTWTVTSFVVLGEDHIVPGTSATLTLTSGGAYTLSVTNDQSGSFCGTVGASCTIPGHYSSTSSTITLDPGTEFEATLNYNITGYNMTWTGNIDGIPITATFVKN